jgi:hypothetical protein
MIPPLAHFVWLTPDFPWLNLLAVQSAALRGGFERVVLHLRHELDRERSAELCRLGNVELRQLDPLRCLPEGPLRARYFELVSPAAQSNLLRAALLEREGGVYLDMDTVTIRDLSELRRGRRLFCGLEHVAFPAGGSQLRGLLLSSLREGLRRAPNGWRHFRRLEHLFPRAANNAVLGATPGHPLLRELLRRMATMPSPLARRRYALGTHLLQRVLADSPAEQGCLCDPSVFYPLGPRISLHWFSPCHRPDVHAVISPETRVVHWYASLHTRFHEVTPERLRQSAGQQLFARLVSEFDLLEQKKTSPSSVMP